MALTIELPFNEQVRVPVSQLLDLGRAHFARGELAEALAKGREAFAAARSAEAAILIASALLRSGELAQAEEWARLATAFVPASFAAFNTLGVVLRARGRPAEARAAYERAGALAPEAAEPRSNLGNLLAGEGDLAGALDAYRRARANGDRAASANIERVLAAALAKACELLNEGAAAAALGLVRLIQEERADDPDAHYLAAHACQRLGRNEEAAGAAERLTVLRPLEARGFQVLALVRRGEGRMIEAEAAYRRAVALEPGHDGHHQRLASFLMDTGRLDEARASTRRAAELAPLAERPHSLEAVVWQKAGQLRQARLCLLEAEKRAPSTMVDLQLVSRLSVMGQLGDLEGRAKAEAVLREILSRPGPLAAESEDTLFRLAFLSQFYAVPDGQLWRILRDLGQRIARSVTAGPALAPGAAGDRLRIGYLSPNLGEHPTGHLVAPLLEAHDRTRFEIHAYSTMDRTRDPGPYPARLRSAVDRWHELPEASDEVIAGAIRAERIDVLVDLGGYLAGGRPGVLARRAAPVQLHWIMHLAGMPAPFVDWSVVDDVMVPSPSPDELHGPLIRLANSFQPGYRQEVAADPGTRAQWGLPPTGPVFCAFNNPLKIDQELLTAWMAILKAVPGSTLWLSGRQRLEGFDQAAMAHGVEPARIAYAPFVADRATHLARQRLATLYLDSFTFGGATSSMDALLAGLPVLTRQGDRAFGRIGASFLDTMGLPELIAPDTGSYVARAIELAHAKARLEQLRQRVVNAVAHGPLFDARSFARDLEAAFQATIERRCRGAAPASLHVDRQHRVSFWPQQA